MRRALVRFILVALAAFFLPTVGNAQVPKPTGGQVTPLCQTGCGGGGSSGVSVTPDGSPTGASANSTNQVVNYFIINTGTAITTYSLTCVGTGAVTCTRIKNLAGTTITSITLDSAEAVEVDGVYSTGSPGTGILKVTATAGTVSDSGSYIISVTQAGAPTVALIRTSGTVADRSLCFTAGAGPAAGLSCGDLFVTHGMPAYRTKGRDRSLGLLYNSATAKGTVLVDADVLVPTTQTQPNYVHAVLTVGTQQDSADFQSPTPGSHFQLALGKRITNLATGSYPVTLLVRNVYGTTLYDVVTTGRVMVVNRASSPFGRGWGLLGVEGLQNQLLDSVQNRVADTLVWRDGDGSAGLYTKVTTNTWVAPKADFRDTITYDPATLRYTRALKHRVKVVFDSAGRHLFTVNRYSDTTAFTWTVVAGQRRLTSIRMPPNDGTVRQYRLIYSPTSALLDTIYDPGNRRLVLSRTGDQVTSITDPDGQATTFTYDATHLLMTSRATVNPAGPGGKTTVRWVYANGMRVTRVVLPSGAAGTDSSVTTVAPWDEMGLGIATVPTQNPFAALDANGQATLLDGPIPGTGDRLEVVVDSFGSAHRTLRRSPDRLTIIDRTNTSFPSLVTNVATPSGEVFALAYDGRGNLVSQRDVTSDLATRISTWAYGAATEPDAPSASTDSIGGVGRTSTYTYDANGELQHAYAPNGAHTEFSFIASGANRGLMQWTKTYGVQTLDSAMVTSPTRTLQTSFTYDVTGNALTDSLPNGVVTTMQADSLGRVVATWDPYGTKVRYAYDVLNRVTDSWQYTSAKTNTAYAGNPLAHCETATFYCGTDSTAILPMQAGFADSLRTRSYYGSVGPDSILDPRNVVHGTRYNGSGQGWITTDETRRGDTTFIGTTGLVDLVKTRDSLTVRYYYDGMGRRTAMVFPFRRWAARKHAAADSVPGDSIVTAYDSLDRVIQIRSTGASGDTVAMTYYTNGALRSRASVWRGQRDTLFYTYDDVGALYKLGHTSVNGTTVILRDTTTYFNNAATGFLDSIKVDVKTPASTPLGGGAPRTFRFQHDTLGRETLITYPTGLAVHKGYDALGALRQLYTTTGGGCSYGFGGGRNLCFSLAQTKVRADGQVLATSMSCGWADTAATGSISCGTDPTVTTTSRFYRTGWMASQLSSQATQQFDSTLYDASGNITRRHKYNEEIHYYLYAASSNRLSVDSSSGFANTTLFTFTGAGDRNTEWVKNIDSSLYERDYTYDGLGRAVGIGNFQAPDNNADPINWNFHQLLHGTGIRYNALGQMIQTEGAITEVNYDGENVVSAIGGSDAWHFLQEGLDSPLMAWYTGSGITARMLYFVTDGNGRQYAVGDTLGNWDQATYGNTNNTISGWTQGGGVTAAASFHAGHQGSGVTPQISFFRNRLYDQRTGKWTQEDPMGVGGGINLYQYNGNNPTMFSDPFGLCTKKDGGRDCKKMISARRGEENFQKSVRNGEWTYSQYPSGVASDPSTARPGERLGDCTDQCRLSAGQTMGAAWLRANPKVSTGMFNYGSHPGFTEVDRSGARTGDVVVQGGHAGTLMGFVGGEAWAWANNGRPSTSPKGYHDGDTGMTRFEAGDFGPKPPRFFRPIE